MNKSIVTNALAVVLTLVGYLSEQHVVFTVGLFALSGAITNWLAVHMLFEKIPGLYGSGVIPARFEDFKAGIRHLMMEQFFTEENIDRFLSDNQGGAVHFELAPVIEKVDLSPSFSALIEVVEASSFGSMLAMVGGRDALMPLQDSFIEKMKLAMVDISKSDEFTEILRNEIEQPSVMSGMREKVSDIIEKRLDELTPQQVKEIIQEMIKKHLGWLVVWGGVFGGIIGLIAALSNTL